jgi:Skp family chaperone for outer membrane proteins
LRQGALNVKKSRVFVVVLGTFLVLALAGAIATAQQPARSAAPAAPAVDIVLIDVGAIFKQYPYFKARMNELQADVEAAEAKIKKDRDHLRSMMDELGRIKAGTQEYKDFEAQVFEFRSKLDTNVQLQRKEFLSREAKIYHQAYQEVQQEVAAFAKANSISVVLKFNREAPDPEKPDEIIRDLNKPVLYHAGHLDITNYIIDLLAKRAGGANPAANTGSRQGVPERPR